MPQYFFANPDSDMGEVLSSGLKAGNEFRELDRKRKLQEAYNASLNPDNSFDNLGFMERAKAAGVGLEADPMWMKRKNDVSDVTTKEAQNAADLELYGRKPDVLRDWFAEEQAKKKAKQEEEARRIESERISKLPGADQFLNPSPGNTDIKPIEQPIQKTNTDYANEFGGQVTIDATDTPYSKGPEGKMTAPEMWPGQDVVLKDPPKRYDIIEEALRREEGVSSSIPSTGYTPTTFTPTVSASAPQDVEGNEYRKYKQTAENYKKSTGMDYDEYLKGVGQAAYNEKIYIPNEMAWKGKDGKTDRAALGAERAKYQKSLLEAQAAGDKAIMEARGKMEDLGKAFGTTTVDDRALEIGSPYTVKQKDKDGKEIDVVVQDVLRDKSYRTQAQSLYGNITQIKEISEQLKYAVATQDKAAMASLVPTMAVIASTARNPGQQPSQFSIEEVARSLEGLGLDLTKKGGEELVSKVAAWVLSGMKGPTPVKQILDQAAFVNPVAFGKRMTTSLKEYKTITDNALDKYVIRGGKEDNKEGPDDTKIEPPVFKEKDWYKAAPGDMQTFFKSKSGGEYQVTKRDRFGMPSEATNAQKERFSLTPKGDQIIMDQLEEAVAKGRKARKARKTGPTSGSNPSETAAERLRRLKGK